MGAADAEHEGRFGKVCGGVSIAAVVSVRVARREPGQEAVALACRGRGFTAQGAIEDARESGYDDWKSGAMAGAEWALARLGRDDVAVTVARISGLPTDTNETAVAVAAAAAVHKALGADISSDMPSLEEAAALSAVNWKMRPAFPPAVVK